MLKQKAFRILAEIVLFVSIIPLNAQVLEITDVVATDVSCGGYSDGEITVTITGGVPPYQYGLFVGLTPIETSPSTSSTSFTFTGHPKYGFYNIIVVDSDVNTGAVVKPDIPIGGPDPISINSESVTDMSCNGVIDGTITVAASGEDGNYIFDLSPPVPGINTSGLFEDLNAGDYTVTVSHDGSCTSTATTSTLTISDPSTISIGAVNITPVDCYGDFTGSITIVPSGGTPSGVGTGYTYEWTGPNGFISADEDISNLESGNYSVDVFDANLCVASAGPLFVSQSDEITATFTPTDITCNGLSDGKINVNSSGGKQPHSYSWTGPSGFTSAQKNINGLLPGDYELTITDDLNCIMVFPIITIVEPDPITASATVVDSDCFGANNGSINIVVAGGTSPYIFAWTGPNGFTSPDQNITNLEPGNYSVTVSDANTCSQLFTDIAIVDEPTEILVNASPTDITCNGLTDGAIDITVSGGVLPYGFNWSGPGTFASSDQNLTGLAAGQYSLVIRDGNSCIVNFPNIVTILEPPPVVATYVSQIDVSCYAGNDGSIEINASGGTPPLSFDWTDASGITISSNEDPSGLPAGSYSLTITDFNGCTFPFGVMATITEAPEIIMSLAGTNIECFGDGDGTITVSASGGTGTLEYSIQGDFDAAYQAGNTFTNLGSGPHTIWTRDLNRCVVSDTISITEPDELIVVAETRNSASNLCFGDANGFISIDTVSGGTLPYSYSINNGIDFQSSAIFNDLVAGDYQTIVLDDNGCQAPGNLNKITQPAEIIINSYTPVHVSTCFGDPTGQILIEALGGTGTRSYTLNGTDTNQTGIFTGLLAGIYTIDITDENSCLLDTTVEILGPPELIVNNAGITHISGCAGDATGEINVTGSGGIAPISYSLNGAPYVSSGSFINLIAGDYIVTVKDNNDCTLDTALTITEPLPFAIDSETGVDVSCTGAGDGSIVIEVSGGTVPYDFTLTPGPVSNSTGTFNNLTANDYTVVVDDASGCGPFSSSIITITEPPQLVIDSVNHSEITCNGASNGEIHIFASGGTPPLAYSIDDKANFLTTPIFTSLGPGTYEVYVRDSSGCEEYGGSITLTEPSPITLDISETDVMPCFGDSTGAISALASGGTGLIVYSLDGINYQATGDFSNLLAGSYTIYARDELGCIFNEAANINEPADVFATITKTDATYGNLGTITISGTIGGTSPYLYSIDGPGGLFTSETFYDSLDAASYLVIIRDINGCEYEETIDIYDVPPLNVTINATDVRCFGADDGTIEFVPQDAVGAVSYSIDDGLSFTSTALFENLAGNTTYYLVAIDEDGKVFKGTVVINEPAEISVLRNITPAKCNAYSETGAITVSVSGGTGAYSFLWSNGETKQNLDSIVSGDYTLLVTDENGCTYNENIFVNSIFTVGADAGEDTTICQGSSIQLEGQGGANVLWTPSTYLSDPLDPNPMAIGVMDEISYVLKVTEDVSPYNCYNTDTITISVLPVTGVHATPDTFMIRGTSVQLNAEGGPFESYRWEPAAGLDNPDIADPLASPSVSVRYYVFVMNENGCEEYDSTFIEVIENIEVYNVFSPNGDGTNDYFDIENASRFPEMIVEVYTRWGDKVFSSRGYTDDKRWDGIARGKEAPVGTYYYIIIPYNGAKPITGNVTIIR